MATKMTQVTRENLQYFWEKVKEYYSSNDHSVAVANSLFLSEEERITGPELIDLINQAIEELRDNVPDRINTFKKLANWVQTYFTTEESFVNTIERLDDRIDNLIIGGYDLGPVDPENEHKPVSGADIATYVDSKVLAEENRAKTIEQDLDNRVIILEGKAVEIGPVDSTNTTMAVSGAGVVNYVDSALSGEHDYVDQKYNVLSTRVNNIDEDIAIEQTTRITADTSLSNRITVLEQGAASKAYTDQQVANEVSARSAADSALDIRITALENGGASQEYTDQKVGEERTRAEDVEQGLDIRITALEEGGASQSYTDQKIAEEASARSTADNALDIRVTSLETLSVDIPDIKSSIATINNQMSAIQTTVGNLSINISEIASSVEASQHNISDLEDALGDISERVADLEEIDSTVTAASEHAVKSSGIAAYVEGKQADIMVDVNTMISPVTTSLSNHKADKNNPHEVTKEQVGLGNVDDTADIDKPISTAVQAALDELEGKIPSDIGDLEEQVVQLEAGLSNHTQASNNPHHVTAEQLNLGAFENLTPTDLPISDATQEALTGITGTVEEHITNKNNPHEVTAKQVGLDKVVNKKQSSSYIIEDGEYDSENDIGRYFTMHGANQMYVHFTEVDTSINTEVAKKLNADTVRDGLTFDDIDKPLSANQGMILNGMISNVKVKVDTLASPLIFKGVVTLVEDLEQLEATNGDVYQVSSTEEFYAYNGNEWVQIFVNVDIVNYMSNIDDAYDIIDNYGNEEEEIDG